MPNSPFSSFTTEQLARYQRDLIEVLKLSEKRITDIIAGTIINSADDLYDTAAILNSQPQLIAALAEAGYPEAAAKFTSGYEDIVKTTNKSFANLKLPPPQYSKASVAQFRQISIADLSRFNDIGANAMNDLRFQLYKQAVGKAPFSTMVETIAASTTGTAANGSALSAYASTHANTAILGFAGESIQAAAESIGFTEDDDLWQVVGPSDSKTRDVCISAINRPIRTKAEWEQAPSDFTGSYFANNPPGGWNCRHQLFPYVPDA